MRADYDLIAERYDRNPIRQKDVDPDLVAWHAEQGLPPERCVVADVGCGTGNQLVSNRNRFPAMRMIGIDPSIGMLSVAKSKRSDILWIQAPGEDLPLAPTSIDYLSNQFSYHHVEDRRALFAGFHRVLKPGGRLVLIDMDPREMADAPFYAYFPEAFERDLQDFLPATGLHSLLVDCGFVSFTFSHQVIPYQTNLASFREIAAERTACSQLTSIPVQAHKAGMDRIDADIARQGPQSPFYSPFATVRVVANKPAT